MKEHLLITLDTQRVPQIQFSRPPDTKPPSTREEAGVVILSDIKLLSNALALIIDKAHSNGYYDKTELVHSCVKTLYDVLDEPTGDNIEENPNINEPEKLS